ncbi:hypothetical protein LZ480_02065 [Solibacillus sp. MA9]|uniref:DGQHR domain-containing protein n=1 Tax=Solibacillus palustris TaxID=2908203 RepID=A0ABS9U8I8_9BACL|nr:DNA sulfur modification protein DndB [Solibacillus sp. MA9]MCH7320660.1 hypothetical protein [Solibacillus sp. MA9]
MFIHSVFNKKQTFLFYSIEEFLHMAQLNNLKLRNTNPTHVNKIRKYVVDNFMKESIYFPPIVACLEAGETIQTEKPMQLTVIDGSSRIKALTDFDHMILKLISDDDEKNQRKGFFLKYRLKEMKIAVQIFEGLSEEEINQLYIDMNSKGKKVALSKRISHDSRDAINVATNKLMASHKGLNLAGIEVERASVIRPNNQKFLSLAQLRTIVILFITGTTSIRNVNLDNYGQREFDEVFDLLCIWFDELFALHPAETVGDYHQTMLASFSMIYAIVHYVNFELNDVPIKKRELILRKRMKALHSIDWRRDQDLWLQFEGNFKGKDQYYYINQNKRTTSAIVKWLFSKGGE